MILGPSTGIRGSGDNLSNYFYQLSHAANWRSRNCFGRVITGEKARLLGAKANCTYHLALKVVAMGDHNAVDIAQRCHERLLEKYVCMTDKDKLIYGSPLPKSDVMEGCYIDDHLVVGTVKRCDARGPGRDREVMAASRRAYEDSNLPLSNKSFHEEGNFIAWGTEVRSEEGRVGTPRSKRLQLMVLGLATAMGGLVTKKMTQALLELFVHSMCHRREVMATLQRSYTWAASLPVGVAVRLPADIKDELAMGSLMLSLAVTNIRAPISTTVTCSDATPSRAGLVSGVVSRQLSHALFAYCDKRGHTVRLGEVLEVEGEDAKASIPETSLGRGQIKEALPSELTSCIKGVDWKIAYSGDFAHSKHVNLQELKAARFAVRQAVSRSLEPEKLINGVDSQVVLGAVAKGRSASYKLNAVLRSLMSWQITGNKKLCQF